MIIILIRKWLYTRLSCTQFLFGYVHDWNINKFLDAQTGQIWLLGGSIMYNTAQTSHSASQHWNNKSLVKLLSKGRWRLSCNITNHGLEHCKIMLKVEVNARIRGERIQNSWTIHIKVSFGDFKNDELWEGKGTCTSFGQILCPFPSNNVSLWDPEYT